jgi:hypothetical protein
LQNYFSRELLDWFLLILILKTDIIVSIETKQQTIFEDSVFMSIKPISTALITYTPPKTSMEFMRTEFIRFEAERLMSEVRKLLGVAYSTSPTLSGRVSALARELNGEEIAEILQAEAGVTIATDKKPIIATYGAGPCVAVGGYEATNKIAFIVHFSNAGEVRNSGGMIFYNIAKLAKEKIEKPIQLHLKGGIKGMSEATVEAIKMWMRQREDLPMEIATQDILKIGDGESLLIDSRTGEVSDYNPLANPKSRKTSEQEAIVALMSTFEPNITLAYSPK